MHVLHFIPNFLCPVGGAEFFVRGLVDVLETCGVKQTIATNSSDSYPSVHTAGVNIEAFPMKKIGYYKVIRGLRKCFRDKKYDIINVHGYGDYPADLASILRKFNLLGNKGLVLTTHGISGLRRGFLALNYSLPYSRKERFLGILHRYGYDYFLGRFEMHTFDKVIVLSEEEKKYLSRIGLKSEKMEYIPIAIDDIFFNRTHEKNYREYILYVGRLDPFKGLDILLAAMKRLHTFKTKIKCLIVGKDEGYKSRLQGLITDFGLEGIVEIRDFIAHKEIMKIYSRAIVTVLPSVAEGFPLSLVESMACGTPFIGTPVGAIPDLVKSASAGILIPLGDSQALANAIKTVVEDKEKWLSLSNNGIKFARNYSFAKVAPRYLKVYTCLAS